MPAEELTREFLERIMTHDAPFSDEYGFVIESFAEGRARIRLPYQTKHIRPGGSISGPAMFALADFTLYVAVLSAVGPKAMAVTTNMSIDFLRKPSEADLIADAVLVKVGRRLAVGRIELRAEGDENLCAHATGTYSIPPQ